uniref:Uncharacterized protein n=1 Tax=Amphimedon queenslandica TaxID=400682 RepID=A0A1X7TIY6_AMPQE
MTEMRELRPHPPTTPEKTQCCLCKKDVLCLNYLVTGPISADIRPVVRRGQDILDIDLVAPLSDIIYIRVIALDTQMGKIDVPRQIEIPIGSFTPFCNSENVLITSDSKDTNCIHFFTSDMAPQPSSFGLLKLEEQLTCPFCLEHYTNPKTLPCLHSFGELGTLFQNPTSNDKNSI